ncbi:MAG: ShlB/FhaC/HecB family hemolysin secretion/activation protein, partial [Gammaproteobacteria bacterium]
WARRFGRNRNEFVFRTDVQISNDPLLPLEQFAIGGAGSVRGYRENRLVRDNGWVSSAELRVPVFHDEMGVSRTQLLAFFDYGRSWNTDLSTPDPSTITSAGLGIRWSPTPRWKTALYGAVPFRNFDDSNDDLQDAGIHFSISHRLF